MAVPDPGQMRGRYTVLVDDRPSRRRRRETDAAWEGAAVCVRAG